MPDQPNEYFEVRVSVHAPETITETAYGPRSDRVQMAKLVVPVEGDLAWRIFGMALDASTRPSIQIVPMEMG